MDNKITKPRLSNFFAYEWILMIIIIVCSILVLEFIYTVSAVRLTYGQSFKYYYDENIVVSNSSEFYSMFNYGKKDSTFSYDVLSFNQETLSSSYNVLSARLSIKEGDIIITDKKEGDKVKVGEEEYIKRRSQNLIDSYNCYSMEKLISDAKDYLARFINEGGDVYDFSTYNTSRIINGFDVRNGKDNRFRSDEQKIEGYNAEIDRIKKLSTEVEYFEKVFNAHPEIFYKYHKYEQTYKTATDESTKAQYKELYEGEEELCYGLDTSKLKNGQKSSIDFFKVNSSTEEKPEYGVILAFNFYKEKGDLQFETICFLNTIIRQFSDISFN